LTTKFTTYKGQFHDNLKSGLGTISFKTGARYEGLWDKGRFHGRGIYFWPDGRRYDGEWHEGMRTGESYLILFTHYFCLLFNKALE
jgi:hypothetical protein